MSEKTTQTDRPDLPEANVRQHRRRVSLIWIIPAITLLIGLYLAWTTLQSQGPTITITFKTAEGLKAGQSQLKHKDVVLGTVRSISLSDDFNTVLVTVELRRGLEPLLTNTARIWVVKPRFFAGSIQGLDTLLAGSYIDFLPGDRPGEATHDFRGLEDPPVVESNEDGVTVLVRADRLGSVSIGSPVFFRDLSVGSVLGWDIADMAEFVTLHVFIKKPFDKYVTPRSRFWNASGVSVNLGGNGLQVQLESLRAVLLGGVAFDNPASRSSSRDEDSGSTPGGASAGTAESPDQVARTAAANAPAPSPVYTLYKDEEAATSSSYGRTVSFESVFEGSVRGLAVGATVDLKGIKIGQVTAISLRYDPKRDAVIVPVRYEVQPDRITNNEFSSSTQPIEQTVRRLVQRGLRAKLASANLITGAQTVSIDVEPNVPPADIDHDGDTLIIPSMPGGGLESITASASALLDKINAIPFPEIGNNLNATLAGVSAIASGPELKQTMADLRSALDAARDLIQKADREAGPALSKLPQIANNLQGATDHANKLLGALDTSYGGDSRFKRDLDRLLAQLNDTATSVRVLADLLTRHPEALIRGRTGTGTE